MNANQLLRYVDEQVHAIEALIEQLDEVQVRFNSQFDEFKAQHDAKLDELTDLVTQRIDALHPDLRAAIQERIPVEREAIDERRRKVQETYLPQRQQAADELLKKGQSQLAALRKLNPQLDKKEEELKREKAELEGQLAELNKEIQQKSRRLGVVRHFIAITKADRERQRVIGKLESVNDRLHNVRLEWEQKHSLVTQAQAQLKEKWQLESVAVARLEAELDQLDNEERSEDLARRRAIRHVLDALKEPSPVSEPELSAGLSEMVELNIQTDDYHKGLASVGGMIGLLRGIKSGMQAIHRSIEGLRQEQRMHKDYLKPLDFYLPPPVEAFHKQWNELAHRFADEKAIGAHPADFSSAVRPLQEAPLSQANIEAMFGQLGNMIEQATTRW